MPGWSKMGKPRVLVYDWKNAPLVYKRLNNVVEVEMIAECPESWDNICGIILHPFCYDADLSRVIGQAKIMGLPLFINSSQENDIINLTQIIHADGKAYDGIRYSVGYGTLFSQVREIFGREIVAGE